MQTESRRTIGGGEYRAFRSFATASAVDTRQKGHIACRRLNFDTFDGHVGCGARSLLGLHPGFLQQRNREQRPRLL